jgi:hypothetical protein
MFYYPGCEIGVIMRDLGVTGDVQVVGFKFFRITATECK